MNDKSTTDTHKELYSHLNSHGLLEYGSAIKSEMVCDIIGIHYPEHASKQVYDRLSLIEMSAIDYVRNILLDNGKYITQVKGDYRILLPSENAKQIASYITASGNKLDRAARLLSSMPEGDFPDKNKLATRMLMKRDSLRSMKQKNGGGSDPN